MMEKVEEIEVILSGGWLNDGRGRGDRGYL